LSEWFISINVNSGADWFWPTGSGCVVSGGCETGKAWRSTQWYSHP